MAARPAHQPIAADIRPYSQPVTGVVIAVRRVSREITVRTTAGRVHAVTIAPGAKVAAQGAGGFNAVRSGCVVHLTARPQRNGKLLAYSVVVH